MRFPLALVALLAVACLTGCGGRTTAAGGAARVLLSSARDGGTIAYGGALEPIYVSRASGAGLHQAVRGEANGAALSSDGKLLAFGTGEERVVTWIVGTDGRGRRRLPGCGYRPDWSPDGKALVLLSDVSE